MRDSRALAVHLIRTIHGEMWHGPAVGELLLGVSPVAAVEGLDAAYQSLAEATAALDEAQLETRVPGQEYTARILLHGVVEHGTYHGGQIALLRRALRVSP